jgi:hypothetical protein
MAKARIESIKLKEYVEELRTEIDTLRMNDAKRHKLNIILASIKHVANTL